MLWLYDIIKQLSFESVIIKSENYVEKLVLTILDDAMTV